MNAKKNYTYSTDPTIRNRERAQDAEAALVAYFAIKNPGVHEMDPDGPEGHEALIDLLSDLRHWARWRDEDYAAADAMSEMHFTDEVADEGDTAQKGAFQ